MFILIFTWFAVKAQAAPLMSAGQIDSIVLDKPYKAMQGPFRNIYLPLAMDPADEFIWVTGSKVEVLDHGHAALQYLCHSRFGVVPGAMAIKDLAQIRSDADLGVHTLFAISQGEAEMRLPPGFGLKVYVPKGSRQMIFGAQLEAPGGFKGPVTLDVKASLDYLSEREGVRQNLIPLQRVRRMIGGGTRHLDGEMVHAGFTVPPGKHSYSSYFSFSEIPGTLQTVTLHYLKLHLHPYAQAVEIFDMTANQRLWRGRVQSDPKTGTLQWIDHYSSRKGLTVNSRHILRLTADYDNQSKDTVDGMAAVTAFYE